MDDAPRSYRAELIRAMGWLASDPRTLFVGQQVAYSGNAMYGTLRDVPAERRVEMPVAEDFQMGFALGLALEGFVPITSYPRFDFLVLAANQLVNHLDKIATLSQGAFQPRVIVRTSIGSVRPLDAGEQHTQNHTEAFRLLLRHVKVVVLDEPEQIFPAYRDALCRQARSAEDCLATLLIEWGDLYNEK